MCFDAVFQTAVMERVSVCRCPSSCCPRRSGQTQTWTRCPPPPPPLVLSGHAASLTPY